MKYIRPLPIPAGMVNLGTEHTTPASWHNGNLFRFRNGLAETVNGWRELFSFPFAGRINFVEKMQYSSPSGDNYIIGAYDELLSRNYLIRYNTLGEYQDITPPQFVSTQDTIRFVSPENSLQATITISTPQALQASLAVGDRFSVFTDAPDRGDLGDINVRDLFQNHTIASIADNVITVTLTETAPAVNIAFLGRVGYGFDTHTTLDAEGYGVGAYGAGAYGDREVASTAPFEHVWSITPAGRRVFITAGPSQIYEYYSDRYATALPIGYQDNPTNTSAIDPPTITDFVVYNDSTDTLFALATNQTFGTVGEQDNLLVRWAARGDSFIWTPSDTSDAGDISLDNGNRIVGNFVLRENLFIWTENTLYAITPTNDEFYYALAKVGENITIYNHRSITVNEDTLWWVGLNGLYSFTGEVRSHVSPIHNETFKRINPNATNKIFTWVNAYNNELWIHYPKDSSTTANAYMIYNMNNETWSMGDLERDAVTTFTSTGPPILAETVNNQGRLLMHESGDSADGMPLNARIETSYINASEFNIGGGAGNNMSFAIHRFLSDFTFFGNGVSHRIRVSIYLKDKKRDEGRLAVAFDITDPNQEVQTKSFGMRGRYVKFVFESMGLNDGFAIGVPRLEMVTSGRI